MKYVINREEFVKKMNESVDKTQFINEVMSNDIGWGDSLVGRMFASIFRVAKMGVDNKRVDFALGRLKSLAESTIVLSVEEAKKEIETLKQEAETVAKKEAFVDAIKNNQVDTAVKALGQAKVIEVIAELPEEIQPVFLAIISNSTALATSNTSATASGGTNSIASSTDKPEGAGVSDKPEVVGQAASGDEGKLQKIQNTINSLKKIIEDKKAKGEDTAQDENQLAVAERTHKVISEKLAKAKAEAEKQPVASAEQGVPDSIQEAIAILEHIVESLCTSLNYQPINEELTGGIKTNSILDAFRKQTNKEVKEMSKEDAEKELPNAIKELEKSAQEDVKKIAQEANETGKKYETVIKSNKKVLTDPIEVLRIFNDVNRIMIKGNIPSVRTGGKVSVSRANNWEKLDGSSVNPTSPGGGPFRNIKLFSKWNDGVLALMKDKALESFFNSKWILVDGEEKQVSYTITSFITDMLNDQQAFGKPGYQKTYLEKHFGVKGVSLGNDAKKTTASADATEEEKAEQQDVKEWSFVEYNENLNISNFADKKSFRVKCTYKMDGKEKEGYVYFVGYNNTLENNELINKDIFKGSKLFQVSLDNDYYISQYKGSSYKPKSSVDVNKQVYSVIVNDKDFKKEGSFNLYALPAMKRDQLAGADPSALDIKKITAIDVLSKEGKPVVMNVGVTDKDNQLKKSEKWFPYTQKETVQIMYDKFSKMKGFRAA
jgi:hypothetical protein